MPEGHTIHRTARDHARTLAGGPVRVTSPQGRFAAGAATLDGAFLRGIDAWGKHLFYRFEPDLTLHVHLGLYGKFWPWTPPPAATHRQVRLRLEGKAHGYDLTGPSTLPRSIRARDAVGRLLSTAAAPDPRARRPWPARDLAVAATFCVTGVREAEAVGLDVGSLQGEPGARRLEVVGKGRKVRPVPIDPSLDTVLGRYLDERRAMALDGDDLDHPSTPLFVDVRGRRLTVDQIRYLIERLYVRAGIRAQVPAGALVHALRHTFATSALEAGADVVELQELLGHASLETTRRYLSATAQGLRHVIQGHPSQAAVRAALADRPADAAGDVADR
ncbi:tyrosine-type recombinase/integrase [Acidimicrobiaceae bacterium USS-CC1]|uniref:Tyrosine-type recombinase/integrase n=1 Tax=Acidiferrimicrobium australe TaxID=2664430 RepID=A0ABW9QXF0_9ACTN|nr:tyrosine-type recombinase/integrase [Acidiferrimicrobium australe]